MDIKSESHELNCRERQRVMETYWMVNLRTGLNRSETRSMRVGRNSLSKGPPAPDSSSLSRRKLWSFDGTSEANFAALSRLAILSLEIGDIIPTIAVGKSGTLVFSELQLAVLYHMLVKSNEIEKASVAGETDASVICMALTGIFLYREICAGNWYEVYSKPRRILINYRNT